MDEIQILYKKLKKAEKRTKVDGDKYSLRAQKIRKMISKKEKKKKKKKEKS